MTTTNHINTCLRLMRQQTLQKTIQRINHPQNQIPSAYEPLRQFSTSLLRSVANASLKESYSAAPIIPPKSEPPSKNVDFKPHTTSPALKLAKEVRKRATGITETYIAYGVTETLVKECSRQADYSIPQASDKGVTIPKTAEGEDLGVGTGWWYEKAGLTPTFNTWAQITLFHMYLLTVRMRCFPPDHAPAWHQHLIDHFSYAAEDRMVVLHNISSRMLRNRYLKDLFVQWRGLTAGYDEGLVRGDAVLATAVWRNVFKGDEDVDLRRLGQVVSYMRHVLSKLDAMADEEFTSGDVVFGDPESEAAVVRVRSKMMDQPSAEGEGEPSTKVIQGQVASGLGMTS